MYYCQHFERICITSFICAHLQTSWSTPLSLKFVQHLRRQHITTRIFFQQLLVRIDVDLQYQRTTKPQRDLELFLILQESHSFKCDKELISPCLRRQESFVCTTASLKCSIPAVSNYIGCSAVCSMVLNATLQRLKP